MNENTGHSYTVEIRVYGPTLDPAQVTRETGLKPSRTQLAGSPRGTGKYEESMWAFNGGEETEWGSLEEGLAFVLDRLSGCEELFARYKSEYDVVWWCGHFQSSFDGGPILSAHILERVGAFGVELFIDNYFHQRDPAE
jgi:hypothetical protein